MGDTVTAFRELIETLEDMLLLYKALIGISLSKKDCIIQNRIEELTAAVAQESKLLKRVTELEPIARSTAVKLQREFGVRPKAKIRLTELGKMIFNPSDKQELIKLHGELSVAADNLRKYNELNQQLLQQAMEYVDFTLDVMFGAPDDEVTYKKPALQSQAPKRSGLFDIRR